MKAKCIEINCRRVSSYAFERASNKQSVDWWTSERMEHLRQ